MSDIDFIEIGDPSQPSWMWAALGLCDEWRVRHD